MAEIISTKQIAHRADAFGYIVQKSSLTQLKIANETLYRC